MPAVLRLSGQRFGPYTVLSATRKQDKHGSFMWLAECDCGKEEILTAALLRFRKRWTACHHKDRDVLPFLCETIPPRPRGLAQIGGDV